MGRVSAPGLVEESDRRPPPQVEAQSSPGDAHQKRGERAYLGARPPADRAPEGCTYPAQESIHHTLTDSCG
jgi:hypothetical protein